MADAKVISTTPHYINTDKGKFYFTVSHIDIPITLGMRLEVGINEEWFPLIYPYSVYRYGNTLTEFTTDTGSFSVYRRDGVVYYRRRFLSNDEVVDIEERSPTLDNGRANAFSCYFFIGSNGVPVISTNGLNDYNVIRDDAYFIPNSNDSFGSLTLREFRAAITISAVSRYDIDFARTLLEDIDLSETTDPFDPGGSSGTGGGTGSFDGTGDAISVPSLPTLSAVDSGFITLFNPSLGQLRSLSSYMWSDLFDIDTLKKLFADPMQAILGLSIVPVAVPNSGMKEIRVGNISTGISMNVATSQYVSLNCGTLNVNEYWGAYLDYDPYTKAEIYLPYIGTHAIAVDDIMNKPVQVVYNVDILSGACCANIKCGDSVLYTFAGQCASQIPVTGNDWGSVINGALSIAGAVGSMVATGGATAPLAVSSIASSAVNSVKSNVEKSGSLGGTSGMLGVQVPYLILTRPRQALPRDQNKFIGYPSFITVRLRDLSGYTEIDSIHLENVPATELELSEIESLLKSGVIF